MMIVNIILYIHSLLINLLKIQKYNQKLGNKYCLKIDNFFNFGNKIIIINKKAIIIHLKKAKKEILY